MVSIAILIFRIFSMYEQYIKIKLLWGFCGFHIIKISVLIPRGPELFSHVHQNTVCPRQWTLPLLSLAASVWRFTGRNNTLWCQTLKIWAQFQYEDCPSVYKDFHYQDKTAVRPSYLYNGKTNPVLVRRLYIEMSPCNCQSMVSPQVFIMMPSLWSLVTTKRQPALSPVTGKLVWGYWFSRKETRRSLGNPSYEFNHLITMKPSFHWNVYLYIYVYPVEINREHFAIRYSETGDKHKTTLVEKSNQDKKRYIEFMLRFLLTNIPAVRGWVILAKYSKLLY